MPRDNFDEFKRRVEARYSLGMPMQVNLEAGRVILRLTDGYFVGSLADVETANTWFDGFTAAEATRSAIEIKRFRRAEIK